jgi:hypothetical protein
LSGNFPPENVGKKMEFSAEKGLKNQFSQEIPRKIPWKKCNVQN